MSFLDRFNRNASDEATPGKAAIQPPRDAGTGSKLAVPRAKDAPSAAAQNHAIVLDLGDFLPRIPAELMHPGSHPEEARLKFDIADLEDRIARGTTTIRLSEIYRQVPEVFRREILPSDEIEVRFPWQKVMRMLADARTTSATVPRPGGLPPAAAESLAEKLRNSRAVRNIIPGMSEITGTPHPTVPGPSTTAGAIPHPVLLNDEKLTREEILRAYDAMWSELMRTKGEHEHQVAALTGNLTTIEQERAALDLGREKEAKIKVERQLAAADRMHRESAAQLEEAHAAMRREFEQTARKREAEAGRALKEAQEQVEAAQAARSRMAAELEAAHARLAKSPAPAESVSEAWEARAAAQFEADVANYRSRIKALLAEREVLAGEKEALAARLAVAVQAPGAPGGEPARAEAEIEARFEQELARLRSENGRIIGERDALRGRMEKFIEEQRKMLAEMSTHSGQTGAPAPAQSETGPATLPPRDPGSEPRESCRVGQDVLAISGSEIVPPSDEEPERLKNLCGQALPVHPPQVHIP